MGRVKALKGITIRAKFQARLPFRTFFYSTLFIWNFSDSKGSLYNCLIMKTFLLILEFSVTVVFMKYDKHFKTKERVQLKVNQSIIDSQIKLAKMVS